MSQFGKVWVRLTENPKRGEPVEIRAMVMHPMESGFRLDNVGRRAEPLTQLSNLRTIPKLVERPDLPWLRHKKKKARKKSRAFVISVEGGLNSPYRPCHRQA